MLRSRRSSSVADGMRRWRYSFCIAIVAATLSAGFASCGSSDDSGAKPKSRTTVAGPAPAPRARARRAWSAGESWLRSVYDAADGSQAGAAIAATTGAPISVGGTWREDAAWSTIKVPLLLAYINATGPLGGDDRELAHKLIVDSDNNASNTLFLRLGDHGTARERVSAILRRAQDTTTTVNAQRPDGRRTFTWLGQTNWRLEDGVRVYRALLQGKLAGQAGTNDVLSLLHDAAASALPWGLRAVIPADVPLAEKVGVGTNIDGTVTVEQYAIVGSGANACVIGVLSRGPSEEQAKSTATKVAQAATEPVRKGGCGPG